jgi:hypothetical protein
MFANVQLKIACFEKNVNKERKSPLHKAIDKKSLLEYNTRHEFDTEKTLF